MEQQTLYTQLWECGYTDCIRYGDHCRYRPCTVAQNVMCCKDCPYQCNAPCLRAKGE